MEALLHLFLVFTKVGFLGFGGGYAILPMIYQDVERFGIMSAAEFSDLVALSQVTPGPIAINAATYVGFQAAGVAGATVATVAVSLPSLLLCALLLYFLDHARGRWVQAALAGVRPATVGLMMSAFLFLAQSALFPAWQAWSGPEELLRNFAAPDLVALAIAALTLLLLHTTRIGVIWLTLLGGALGIVAEALR